MQMLLGPLKLLLQLKVLLHTILHFLLQIFQRLRLIVLPLEGILMEYLQINVFLLCLRALQLQLIDRLLQLIYFFLMLI